MNAKIFKKIKLPDTPGVYFFKRGREILYVGKATSLRDRVSSYMSKRLFDMRGPVIVDLIFKADKIDWQETDSVLEALILEAALIKKHQPKYNTKEKSNKSFNYVCISKEKLPRVMVLRGRKLLENNNFSGLTLPRVRGGTHTIQNYCFQAIFGPFPNSSQLREAMKIIRPIFPFLDDKSKNYYKFYKQVDLVPDILSAEGVKQYKNNIKNLKLFFAGKKKQVLKNLEKEMKAYAEIRAFEKAGEVKRQIFALKHINDIALIKENSTFSNGLAGVGDPGNRGPEKKKDSLLLTRIEAYDVAHLGGKNMVGVMIVVENGEVVKSEYKKFKIRTETDSNDTGALSEVLERRFAHPEWRFPDLVVMDGGVAQLQLARKVMSRFDLDIEVVSVLKDEHHKPKDILGNKEITSDKKFVILLANSEAHRFAIAYHKKVRSKNFLKR